MSRISALLAAVLLVSACASEASPPDGVEVSTLPEPTSTTVPDTTTTSERPVTTTTPAPASTTTTDRTGPLPEELIYDHFVGTFEFTDGLELDVHAPDEPGPWPVVVTVHGGGWYVGDRLSMGQLADGLAARDAVVFNISYHTITDGGGFPGTVDEVACAVSYARAHAGEYTTTPDHVVIVGHSAGAHLAAVVATAPGEFGGACGASSAVDGFVGLAGPYDVSRFSGLLIPFFGVSIVEDPETWSAGNPLDRAATAPDIPYLLLHGDLDELVPVEFSEDFAEALDRAGLDVTFEVIPGADHGVLNAPVVVADRIVEFAALSSSGTP